MGKIIEFVFLLILYQIIFHVVVDTFSALIIFLFYVAYNTRLDRRLNVGAQNLNASDGEVDLHGLRADEVSPALDLFFQRKHGQKKELKIISGVGRHSRSGSSEVRVRVAAYLRAHGFP